MGWQDAVAGLQSQINVIDSQISSLNGQESAQQAEISTLQSSLTVVQSQIVELQAKSPYIGNIAPGSIVSLVPQNLPNGSYTPFQLSAGGNAILSPSDSIDSILFKLVVSGYVHIASDFNNTVARIKVTHDSATGPEIYHSEQHSIGSTPFYQEVFLWYSSVTGASQISNLTSLNITSTTGSVFQPASTTPQLFISGGFDYLNGEVYNASNFLTIQEFRLLSV